MPVDIEMRVANRLFSKLAWDIYVLYLVVVCYTVNLGKEHVCVCVHTICAVCVHL